MAYENRFKKGQSGNPNGRPRTGKSFAEIMRKVIDKQTAVKRDKDGNITKTVKGKEVVAEAILQIAMDKTNNAGVRLTAFNTALDRAYGKPLQEIDMQSTVIKNDCGQIKADLDKLSVEEREEYIELCEKMNEQ
jgi:hypothetical protein